jgi:hypothetical protein
MSVREKRSAELPVYDCDAPRPSRLRGSARKSRLADLYVVAVRRTTLSRSLEPILSCLGEARSEVAWLSCPAYYHFQQDRKRGRFCSTIR